MTTTKCPYCAEEIQAEAVKCKHCGTWLAGPDVGDVDVDFGVAPGTPNRLMKSTTDKKISGVCGGLARYVGIDPTLVRIVFLLATFFSGGAGLVVYIILWFCMPKDDAMS